MTRVRTVLVTGASSGIGRAIAERLSARGHRVIGTSRDPQRARAAGIEGVEFMELDVTSQASVDRLATELDARGIDVDVLINNAGHGVIGAAEETTMDETETQLQTNILGVMRVTHALLPGMRERGAGTIVNMSSTGGFFALPFTTGYSASKFALEGYTASLRYELAPFGIHVSLVVPAGVVTESFPRTFGDVAAPRPAYAAGRERMFASLTESTRQGGLRPEDVARSVARIVEQPRPRLRVLVGRQARTLQALKTWLPERLLERIVVGRFNRSPRPGGGALGATTPSRPPPSPGS